MGERTIQESAPARRSFHPEVEEAEGPCLTELCPPPQDGQQGVSGAEGAEKDQRRDAAYEEGVEAEGESADEGEGEPAPDGKEEAPDGEEAPYGEETEAAPDGADSQAPEGGENKGKIEIGADEFEKYFPKVADALKQKGVSRLTIEPTESGFKIGAELKEELVLPNPEFSGENEGKAPRKGDVKETKFDKNISFEIEREKDGSIKLTGIDGMHAKSFLLFKWRDTKVDTMTLREKDNKTVISSTGFFNGIEGKGKTRTEGIEVMRNAERFIERLGEITGAAQASGNSTKMGWLNVPSILSVIQGTA